MTILFGTHLRDVVGFKRRYRPRSRETPNPTASQSACHTTGWDRAAPGQGEMPRFHLQIGVSYVFDVGNVLVRDPVLRSCQRRGNNEE